MQGRGQGGRQEDRDLGSHQEVRGEGGRKEGRGQEGRQDQQQPIRNLFQPNRLKCRFDGRCKGIPNCPFIHSLEDFPLLQRRRTQRDSTNPTQRRN